MDTVATKSLSKIFKWKDLDYIRLDQTRLHKIGLVSILQRMYRGVEKENNVFSIVSDTAAIKCYSCNLLSRKTAQVKKNCCYYAGAKKERKNDSFLTRQILTFSLFSLNVARCHRINLIFISDN